jgi:hypothetical protein
MKNDENYDSEGVGAVAMLLTRIQDVLFEFWL